ncbi:MAG TPA: hypothetical protein VL137_17085 [Polyangiaceae bacterium]|nr:hypothetical protein [Polyangiaceae bacterium]
MLKRTAYSTATLLFAICLHAGSARAQATSACYYDMGRMVDAAPLMGTKISTDEQTGNLHYLQYLPHMHDPAKKWPVIVFMHGIGEVNAAGDMLNMNTKHSLPRQVENPDWDWPFIVISPQIASDGWVNHATEIGAALDVIEQQYGGDPNRIYLTGLSYGGVGTLSVGIALADRIAALMPVNPGGSVDNWGMRAAIKDKPIWFFTGANDAELNTNSSRAMDIETDGGEAFFHYDYAFADEYNDVVPMETLQHKHNFGTYAGIGHDVWHATYGVYCPEDPKLIAMKTTQYKWLLAQSLDGSPFVDPRDPGVVIPPGGGGAGGAAGAMGMGGTAGAAVGGTASSPGGTGGTLSAGGSVSNAGTATGGASAGSAPVALGGGGTAPSASAGSPTSTPTAAAGTPATMAATPEVSQSSGCSTRAGATSNFGLLLAFAALLGIKRRSRR